MFEFMDFRPRKKGISKILGDLESEIMEEMWQRSQATVRDIYESLREKREIAYTTVMTIMTRLAKKSLLEKVRDGAAFMYTPSISREEFEQRATAEVVSGLVDGFGANVFAHFFNQVEEVDPAMLEELERLLAKHRKDK